MQRCLTERYAACVLMPLKNVYVKNDSLNCLKADDFDNEETDKTTLKILSVLIKYNSIVFYKYTGFFLCKKNTKISYLTVAKISHEWMNELFFYSNLLHISLQYNVHRTAIHNWLTFDMYFSYVFRLLETIKYRMGFLANLNN